MKVEGACSVRDGGPVSVTGAVVEWKLEVLDTILLEVVAPSEPPPDLSAEVVSDCLRSPGVDQILVAGVQLDASLSIKLVTFRIIPKLFHLLKLTMV